MTKLEEEIEATHMKLDELAKNAPKLRKKFLLQLQEKVDCRGTLKRQGRLGK